MAFITLYRAVGPAEYADITTTGLLRPGPNSCEGKHFCTSSDDAIVWAKRFYNNTEAYVIEIEINERDITYFTKFDQKLDGVGIAFFAGVEILSACRVVSGKRVLPERRT